MFLLLLNIIHFSIYTIFSLSGWFNRLRLSVPLDPAAVCHNKIRVIRIINHTIIKHRVELYSCTHLPRDVLLFIYINDYYYNTRRK